MSQTEDILSGKYLLSATKKSKSKSLDQLITRFKSVHGFLQDLQQDSEEAQPDQLADLAAELINTAFVHHTDHDVKLLTACCISDIIRLYAPEAPYDEAELTSVFNLFIDQLKGLDDVNDATFPKRFYLLERLAIVNSFVMLADFKSDELLRDLFESFFEMINDAHSNKVESHMLSILACCLGACEISQELLDIIVIQLVEPISKSNPSAYKMARSLIAKCTDQLQQPVSTFINEVIVNNNHDISEHSKLALKITYELNQIDSTLLLYVLPNIASDGLKAEDIDKRKSTVKLLGRMIAAPGSKVAKQYREVFQEWVGRFNDKNPQIRLLMVAFGKHFLQNHPNLVEKIQPYLRDRLSDHDEQVRLTTIAAICDAGTGEGKITLVPHALLEAVAERIKDKKIDIRKKAMSKLAHLYQEHAQHRFTEMWTQEDESRLGWIPNKLLASYYMQDEETIYWLEMIIETVLLWEPDMNMRAIQLLDLFACLDEYGIAAMNKLFQRKAHLQSLISKYLLLRESASSASTADMAQINQSFQTILGGIVAMLPPPAKQTGMAQLSHLHQLKDNKIFHYLSVVASPNTHADELEEARKSLHSQLSSACGSKTPLVAYMKQMSTRASMSFMTVDAMPLLLSNVIECVDDVDLLSHLNAGLTLLKSFVKHFPNSFTDCFAEIPHLLVVETNQDAVDAALNMLISAGKYATTEDRKTLQPFMDELLEGRNPLAVSAIRSVFGDQSKHIFVAHLETEIPSLNELEFKELPSTLSCLAQIALVDPETMQDYADDVVTFVVKSVILNDNTGEGYDDQLELSWDCIAKENALHYLVSYLKPLVGPNVNFISTHEAQASATAVFNVLYKIIQQNGKLGDYEITLKDAEHLRGVAMTQLLELASIRQYEEMITPQQFALLASLVNDDEPAIRSKFLAELHQRLYLIKGLPLRYLAIIPMFANDSESDIVAKAKKHLAELIKIRRDTYEKYRLPNSEVHFLPEYCVPHLLYTLALSSDFPLVASEASMSDWQPFTKPLTMFLKAVLAIRENIQFVVSLLETIRGAEDADDGSNTDRIRVLALISTHLITSESIIGKSKWKTAEGNGSYPGSIRLPIKMFAPGKPFNKQHTTLPNCFLNPQKNKGKSTLTKSKTKKSPPKRKRQSTSSSKSVDDEEDQQDDDEDMDDDLLNAKYNHRRVSGGRRSSRGVSNNGQDQQDDHDDDDDDEDEDDNNDQVESPPKKQRTLKETTNNIKAKKEPMSKGKGKGKLVMTAGLSFSDDEDDRQNANSTRSSRRSRRTGLRG